MAEEAKYNHDERWGEDGAKHDAGQQAVYCRDDQILSRDQDGAGPAIQRAPQLQWGVGAIAPSRGVRWGHHHPGAS